MVRKNPNFNQALLEPTLSLADVDLVRGFTDELQSTLATIPETERALTTKQTLDKQLSILDGRELNGDNIDTVKMVVEAIGLGLNLGYAHNEGLAGDLLRNPLLTSTEIETLFATADKILVGRTRALPGESSDLLAEQVHTVVDDHLTNERNRKIKLGIPDTTTYQLALRAFDAGATAAHPDLRLPVATALIDTMHEIATRE